ncbi:MAG: hypothetical protein RL716_303 [Actinomycetota bacterium]|jgi:tetratricopeptide (TPR) repeat protein|uniref:tetratricopeptide repeat protein n=1 Tax=Rhodoluna sp. TaxID=1969481 RepID=UPI0025E0E0E8|nr:tetratricopeptide repeat protein [Rhodoluna sp.]
MSKAKIGAVVMSALLLLYVALLSQTAISLLLTDILVAKIMGALIAVFPVLGAWAIILEFRFTIALEKLQNRINDEGRFPSFELEVRPSGRAIRASAEKMFALYKTEAENHPDDFHTWFNLGVAYNAAGDRRRARGAMQKAIELSKN